MTTLGAARSYRGADDQASDSDCCGTPPALPPGLLGRLDRWSAAWRLPVRFNDLWSLLLNDARHDRAPP
jgi:hypothetical protein